MNKHEGAIAALNLAISAADRAVKQAEQSLDSARRDVKGAEAQLAADARNLAELQASRDLLLQDATPKPDPDTDILDEEPPFGDDEGSEPESEPTPEPSAPSDAISNGDLEKFIDSQFAHVSWGDAYAHFQGLGWDMSLVSKTDPRAF